VQTQTAGNFVSYCSGFLRIYEISRFVENHTTYLEPSTEER